MPSTPGTAPVPSCDPQGLLAAIDLGSNSFRLEIARVHAGRYERIDYAKETVRLGDGLDAEGRLGEEAAQRGLACLARFSRRLQARGVRHVRALGTQTLRAARNREAFTARARALLGHPVEVISGHDEARLVHAGVALLRPSIVPRLVVDIGGGSTELALGHGERLLFAQSCAVGSIGLSRHGFAHGRFDAASWRAARQAAREALAPALEPLAGAPWRQALGSSGTVGAVARVLATAGTTDGRITPAALRWLVRQCLRAGNLRDLALPGLPPERRPVIGGGLAILCTLAADFGITTLVPTPGGLRQGAILELARRLRHPSGQALPLAEPA